MNKLSKCCQAEVKVEGDCTMYHVCTKCGKPCDVLEDTLEKIICENCPVCGGFKCKMLYEVETYISDNFIPKQEVKKAVEEFVNKYKSYRINADYIESIVVILEELLQKLKLDKEG